MKGSDTTDSNEGSFSAIVRAAGQHAPAVVDLASRVSEIPAPTFAEQDRAAFVKSEFEAQGLESWIDAAGNACARLRGADSGIILLLAHTDTVFPAGTDLTVRRDGDRLIGPGIGDNSLSVAALLTLPNILAASGTRTGPDLVLCANTGEEGLGNLRGVRQAVADYRDQLTAVVAIEGHHLGTVYNRAIASRRLRITVTGPGGHSWGAFGNPSAIHILGEIIAAIGKIPVPEDPKTTYNVGTIEGGVSINTIAPRASLTLDMRSVDPRALEALVERVAAVVEGVDGIGRGVAVRSEVIGDRPGGEVSVDAPIVQAALAVLREIDIEPHLDAGSTDANIPISQSIPAVCIGLTTGGNAHRTDEYIDTGPLAAGLTQLALLISRIGSTREVG